MHTRDMSHPYPCPAHRTHSRLGPRTVRMRLCKLARSGYARPRTLGRGSHTHLCTVPMGWYTMCQEHAFGSWKSLERFSSEEKLGLVLCKPTPSSDVTGTFGAFRAKKQQNGAQLRAVGHMEAARLRMPAAPYAAQLRTVKRRPCAGA